MNRIQIGLKNWSYRTHQALAYGRENLRAEKIISSNLNVDSIENVLFVFIGEFGYGMLAWLPFLNFLSKEYDKPFHTCGLPGSSIFFAPFSASHTEVNLGNLDMMGNEARNGKLNQALKTIQQCAPKKKIVFPHKDIRICGHPWINNNIHEQYDTNSGTFKGYEKIRFKEHEEAINQITNGDEYIVVNIKNYFNWGSDAIKNFYTAEDIKSIAAAHPKNRILLNFPAIPKEDFNVYFEPPEITGFKNIVPASAVYSNCNGLNSVNARQVELFRGASQIYSTQGGNSVFAIVFSGTQTQIKILMRGGFDYPDYMYLKNKLNRSVRIAYESDDLIASN